MSVLQDQRVSRGDQHREPGHTRLVKLFTRGQAQAAWAVLCINAGVLAQIYTNLQGP